MTYAIFETCRNWNSIVFQTSAEIFIAGTKSQRHESGGRILLGDNIDGLAVMLRPIRLGFQMDSIIHTCIHSWPYEHSVPSYGKWDCAVLSGV